MIPSELDVDPFEIESWEEYCRTCLKACRIDLFKYKLGSYISVTNKPIQAELKAFCVKIQGEIITQRLLQEGLLKTRNKKA